MDGWMDNCQEKRIDFNSSKEAKNKTKQKNYKKKPKDAHVLMKRKWGGGGGGEKKGTDTIDKEVGITCLAVISAVTASTVTRETVDLVFTGPSVLTGTAVTLVDVYKDKGHTVSLMVYD